MPSGATTAPIIRSDTLPELRRVLEKLPALRQYLGDILQRWSSFSTPTVCKGSCAGVLDRERVSWLRGYDRRA